MAKREYEAGRPKKPVDQYTLTGEFIASFTSMNEAAEITKIKEPHISACVAGNYKKTGGYIWVLKGLKPSVEQLKKINTNKSKSIYQCDLNGALIAKYPSQKEASKQSGVAQSGISSCILGRIMTSGGYIWVKDSTSISERLKKISNKNQLNSKPIIQYDLNGNFIARHKSQGEAARYIGISQSSISSCVLGKTSHVRNFIFKEV